MAAVDAETMDERPPKARESGALRRDREAEEMSVAEWFTANTTGADCRVRIDRKVPRTGPNGLNCGGSLETVEDIPDDLEEYIRDTWGGGTFQLQLQLPNGNGGWKYGKARQLRIAGPPKMNGMLMTGDGGTPAAAPVAADPEVATTAIGVATRFADRERERADRLEQQVAAGRQQGGLSDLAQLDVVMAPMREELAALRTTNQHLQQQLLAAVQREPPRDEFRDKLLARAVNDENHKLHAQAERYEKRLDELRDNHASELRQLREGHQQELKRIEDRHDRALADVQKQADRAFDDLKQAHAREIKHLERSQDGEGKALGIAHETQVNSLKAEVARLQAQLAESKGELGALRDKKDKTPIEQLKELALVKEQMDTLTGGGGGDENKPWYAQMLDAFGNSEMGVKIVERLAGGGDDDDGADDAPPPAPPMAAPPPARALPPIGRPIKNPEDGKWYIHRGQGMFEGPYEEAHLRQMLQQNKLRARQQLAQPVAAPAAGQPPAAAIPRRRRDLAGAAPAAPAESAAPPPAASEAVPAQPQTALAAPAAAPDAKEISLAVAYLENALGRGVKPEQVAAAGQKLIQPTTVRWIQENGVDRFLQALAAEKPASPLVTQHGRSFIRQVAQLLFRAQT